jgi:peptidyl-prolyl cis-trans isomerase B (cyclophilin B)
MTTELAVDCTQCGAPNLGTKFCENCGAPVSANPAVADAAATAAPEEPVVEAPVQPNVPVDAPPTPRATFGATPVRVFALLSFLLANAAPPLVEYAVYSAGGESLAGTNILSCILISLAGLFLLIAALAGRAGAAGKTFGALFALAYVGIAIFLVFGGVRDFYGYTNSALLGLAYLLLFLSWGLGRPFRGPGYFGLLILVLVVSAWDLVQLIPSLHFNYVGYLAASIAVFAGSLWLTVGLSAVFEGKPRPSADKPSVPLTATTTNALAIAGFVIVLVAIPSSLVLLYSGVFIVLSIVFGHIAIAQIRRTGQRGRGLAVATLIIGYVAIAALIALIVVPLIINIVTLSQLSNSSIGY